MASSENRGGPRALKNGACLEIRRRSSGDRRIVELEGELDLAGTRELREELRRASEGDVEVVVDLRGLRFIDSTGLATLFDASEKARAAGRRLLFTESSPAVMRTLRLTGLDRVLPPA